MTARRLGVVFAVAAFGGAAAAATPEAREAGVPTVRLAIVHVLHGCHAFARGAKMLGPSPRLVVRRGTKLVLRVNCPMDFDLVQVAGPRVRVGGRFYAGTTRTIVFRRAGLYRFRAKNLQTSEEQGLQTLGPDNTLALTVRVTRR